jgi:hypothetical protein
LFTVFSEYSDSYLSKSSISPKALRIFGFDLGYDYNDMQYSAAYRKKAGFNVRCIIIK